MKGNAAAWGWRLARAAVTEYFPPFWLVAYAVGLVVGLAF